MHCKLVVAFVTLEKGDDDKTISNATSQILESLGKIKCCKVLLYPYSHLGSDLLSPGDALSMLKKLGQNLLVRIWMFIAHHLAGQNHTVSK